LALNANKIVVFCIDIVSLNNSLLSIELQRIKDKVIKLFNTFCKLLN